MPSLFTGSLSVETLRIKIPNLPEALKGCRVTQLSDFHYDGLRLSEELLEQAIAASNAARPDLVALTGDFVTHDPAPAYALARRLRQLQNRSGIFAVLGNHDTMRRGAKETVIRALEEVGITVLINQVVYPLGEELAVVGLADLWSKEFNAAAVMEAIAPEVPRIVLSHNPDTAERLAKWRVDLQLSGHTHGGQIVIPGFGPLPKLYFSARRYIPKAIRVRLPMMSNECSEILKHWEWAQGLHRVGRNQLYVNRGLGTYSPGRLFCPPELTVFTLL
jgi:predicted MPP superfamily phosphohydrolase